MARACQRIGDNTAYNIHVVSDESPFSSFSITTPSECLKIIIPREIEG